MNSIKPVVKFDNAEIAFSVVVEEIDNVSLIDVESNDSVEDWFIVVDVIGIVVVSVTIVDVDVEDTIDDDKDIVDDVIVNSATLLTRNMVIILKANTMLLHYFNFFIYHFQQNEIPTFASQHDT